MSVLWFVTIVCGLEALLKVVAFRLRNFCRDVWSVLDVLICLTIIALLSRGMQLDYLLLIARLMRVVTRVMHIRQVARHTVSGNKYRYVDLEFNFDLDLSYITDDLVAMGVPAAGCLRSTYRNPLSEVARFFSKMHRDHFR